MCQSVYPAHYKRLAHSENPLKAHPLVISTCLSTCQACVRLSCGTRRSKPGLNTVTQPSTSGFLAHVNFPLIPESLLLLISSDFLSHFTLTCSQRRIHWGKGQKRENKERALSCFLLTSGHSAPVLSLLWNLQVISWSLQMTFKCSD